MALASAALCGCTWLAPGMLQPGTPISEARRSFGVTGEYALPGGATRLEFARGSFGRQTYMLDFDAAGVLVSSRQVLTEANFAAIAPGQTALEVRMRVGRPAHAFYVPWQKLSVWNYRYWGGDCIVFQISVTDAGLVKEAGYGTDLACGGPNGRD